MGRMNEKHCAAPIKINRLLWLAAKCFLLLSLVIVANWGLSKLPGSSLRFDISDSGLYTLSEQTLSLLSELEEVVTVYLVCESGNEDPTIVHLLEQFTDSSGARFSFEQRDPAQYPGLVSQYTELNLPDNSMIVLSEDRSYVIHYDDIYVANYEDYFETGTYTTDFCGESCLVSAVNYVSSSSLLRFYVTTGHGETKLDDRWESVVASQGAEFIELKLLSTGTVPEDCACLVLFNPASDLTESEIAALQNYLYNGGALLLVTDYQNSDLSRLHAFMEMTYGITATEGIVLEGDSDYCVYGYPFHLLPSIEQHDLTAPLRQSGYPVVISAAQGLTISETVPERVYPRPLLLSSEDAYIKDPYTMTTLEREAGDKGGQYALAVAVKDMVHNARIVWIGSTSLLDDQSDGWSNGGNEDFIINCQNWLTDNISAVSVHAKTVSSQYLLIPANEASALSVVFVGIIPLLFLAIGLSNCYQRRRK